MVTADMSEFERQVIAHHNEGAKALDPQGHLPFPRARRTDPATSHEAAASVSQSRTAQVREWILTSLRSFGPMSDTDLAALHVLDDLAPPCSESSLRTRRSELVLAGLVRDTGERSLTLAGRATIRWEAKP